MSLNIKKVDLRLIIEYSNETFILNEADPNNESKEYMTYIVI